MVPGPKCLHPPLDVGSRHNFVASFQIADDKGANATCAGWFRRNVESPENRVLKLADRNGSAKPDDRGRPVSCPECQTSGVGAQALKASPQSKTRERFMSLSHQAPAVRIVSRASVSRSRKACSYVNSFMVPLMCFGLILEDVSSRHHLSTDQNDSTPLWRRISLEVLADGMFDCLPRGR